MGVMNHVVQKINIETICFSTKSKTMNSTLTGLLRGVQNFQCRNVNNLAIARKKTSDSASKILPTERTLKRQQWFASKRQRVPLKSRNFFDKHLKLHVSLENDPLKLANYIRRLLMKDSFNSAVKIVRNASRFVQCTVSWNHLIDWLMNKGKLKAAFKIYQEMKKRAIKPDAHTYTILFRGCSQSPHSKQVLGNAIAVYQSMLLDKSTVKPNIIHMNAILKMCASAGDLDSMLYFVDELPSSGVRAANSVTFSTVLNALRHNAISRLPSPPSSEQKTQKTQEMVLQSRKIWKDILRRWRKGDLLIDEELVCSMGRILLTSKDKKHWDEILTIVEQTMSIPRQLPLFGPYGKGHSEQERQPQCQSVPPRDTSIDLHSEAYITSESDSSSEVNYYNKSIFKSPSVMTSVSTYAKPGQNSLSLVLSTLLLLSAKEPAKKYWKIFTEEFHVQPDLENYVSYLRMLRLFRASSEALELLDSMPPHFMEAKIFRIAISSCVRDKKNHHAFSNAGKILDLMQKSLQVPDISTILRYLELALVSPSKSKIDSSITEPTGFDGATGSRILRALDRVQHLLLNVKSYIFFNYTGLEQKSNRHEFLVSVEKLIRKSILAHSRLLNYRMVPNYLLSELRSRRHELCHLASRLYMYRKNIGAPPLKNSGA